MNTSYLKLYFEKVLENKTAILVFMILYVSFIFNYGFSIEKFPGTDLPSFYGAAKTVFGEGKTPYKLENVEHSIPDEYSVFPYFYPPPSLLFFYPMSLVTFDMAKSCSLIINHILILLLFYYLFNLFRSKEYFQPNIILLIVFLFAFFPIVKTIEHSQVNILLTLFIVLFWDNAHKNRLLLSSLFLALAIILKTYPGALIVFLIFLRQWKLVSYSILWILLISIVSFIIIPSHIWLSWIQDVLPHGGYMKYPHDDLPPDLIYNQSLNGFIARINLGNISNEVKRVVIYLCSFGILSTSVLVVINSKRTVQEKLNFSLAIALPVIYLIAPYSWQHHLVYLLPTIFLLFALKLKESSMMYRIVFYSLFIGTSIFLGLKPFFWYDFLFVVILWLTSIIACLNTNFKLRSDGK